uniref:Uncharacterized protein n=1 Tax=Arundo donax TaxID=35708 RepID=A0A0A8Z742_ARUDO
MYYMLWYFMFDRSTCNVFREPHASYFSQWHSCKVLTFLAVHN